MRKEINKEIHHQSCNLRFASRVYEKFEDLFENDKKKILHFDMKINEENVEILDNPQLKFWKNAIPSRVLQYAINLLYELVTNNGMINVFADWQNYQWLAAWRLDGSILIVKDETIGNEVIHQKLKNDSRGMSFQYLKPPSFSIYKIV